MHPMLIVGLGATDPATAHRARCTLCWSWASEPRIRPRRIVDGAPTGVVDGAGTPRSGAQQVGTGHGADAERAPDRPTTGRAGRPAMQRAREAVPVDGVRRGGHEPATGSVPVGEQTHAIDGAD